VLRFGARRALEKHLRTPLIRVAGADGSCRCAQHLCHRVAFGIESSTDSLHARWKAEQGAQGFLLLLERLVWGRGRAKWR
jgi:hypothetical protein